MAGPKRYALTQRNLKHWFELTYHQAWRCKEKTKEKINGNVVDSYKLIPWMCQRLKDSNPDTIAEWTCTDDGYFKQLFISYGCSIRGFHSGCRPFLSTDSGHLSGPYRGCLFAASAFDADDHMYPLAYAIVSSENYEDWSWFLRQLKSLLHGINVTIMSDRNPSIKRSVKELFGAENHTFCYRHIKENFSSVLTKKNAPGRKGKVDALGLFDAVMYARLECDCKQALESLKGFSPDLFEWVGKNTPEHWLMSIFPKMRWDKVTSNLAESLNSWLRLERQFTILNFIDEHRERLVTKLYNLHVGVEKWVGLIGPEKEKELKKCILRSEGMVVTRCHEAKFNVHIGKAALEVNLGSRECTCMAWQMSGIPCEHACAAIRVAGHNVYTFVDKCFYRSTQEQIYSSGNLFSPVETHDMPSIDSMGNVEGATVSLKPPITKRPPGRPRNTRIESQFMGKKTVHCSCCNHPGHNRSTCPNPNPSLVLY